MKATSGRRALLGLGALCMVAMGWAAPAVAIQGDAQWIWSAAHNKDEVPVGECYFRKTFEAGTVEMAQVQVTADNRFELFVNGRRVAKGADWRQMQVHQITSLLRRGRNVVAVKVENTENGPAGLVARVLLKQQGGTYEAYATDTTWKTALGHEPGWSSPQFSDSDWIAAVSYGPLGETLPWGNEVVIAGEGARFVIPEGFVVERLLQDSEVGSLIAMTFDARGNLIVSREGGHLSLVTDSDQNGTLDTVTDYCDKIRNCQGLLAVGTRLFAVGDGPEGPALYRLRDRNRDGQAESITKLVGFRGSRGEHGAHAVRLGPDGLLYVLIGDHARVDATPRARSPYQRWYEGDLIRPRHEDPGGHAVGIPSPGGTVFRTDAEGSFVELVAGGLRNAYDFAFDDQGELFTYDADMEWDRGASWYRPTRFNHITAGSEMGWRSGWAKWPDYYLDSLPAALDMGPGSPTGVEFYYHHVFPERYHGALFGCDWSTGRIHAVTFQPHGSTFQAKSEIFVQGRPLNATDIAVGQDGGLYFCTGGRGTDGGVYRVRWEAGAAPGRSDLGRGIDRALRQPQMEADWARAAIARVRRQLGPKWAPLLRAIASEPSRRLEERLRALDLLVCFGPHPGADLLGNLATDSQAAIRAKAAQLMFFHDSGETRTRLISMLGDGDARVRRVACESLLRLGNLNDPTPVLRLLDDEDRFVAFAARRLIEHVPVETWARDVLTTDKVALFNQGSTALVNVERLGATSRAVLKRARSFWEDTPAHQRVDLLRVMQLAMIHGDVRPQDTGQLGSTLLVSYPTGDTSIDRELIRLLTFLQVDGTAEKMAGQIASDLPFADRLHIAAYAAHLDTGWTTPAKLALLKFFEEARTFEGGYSVSGYVEEFARGFLAKLTPAERGHLLSNGEHWPATALSVLASLPPEASPEVLAEVRRLDTKILPLCAQSNAFRRLRVGIIAVLGRAKELKSQQHLRTAYAEQPEYRGPIAMALTQRPDGANWEYLVDALKTAEGAAAREILAALKTVPRRPESYEAYRSVIMQGLRLRGNGGKLASDLLAYWSAEVDPGANRPWHVQLSSWQNWYRAEFPKAPPARLPVTSAANKWGYAELLAFLESDETRQGDPSAGANAFTKAQCGNCHRFDGRGEVTGPDLSTIAQRFQRKEILESIVYPSHVISDQYASRLVMAGGKIYEGLVTRRGASGLTVLLATGEKVALDQADVEQIQESKISAMPEGLLNQLTLEEVRDLFAYLSKPPSVSVARQSTSDSTRPVSR